MASTSFRNSINSLGWSRRDADVPVNTSQQSGLLTSLSSLNPFSDRGYVQLPTTEGAGAPLPAPSRREEEEGWFVCESLSSAPGVIVHVFSLDSVSSPFPLVGAPCSMPLRLAMCLSPLPCACLSHLHMSVDSLVPCLISFSP